jgi:hypothetical protein
MQDIACFAILVLRIFVTPLAEHHILKCSSDRPNGEVIVKVWNRNLVLWRLVVASLLLTLVSGCVTKRPLPAYPSDWPAVTGQGCDCPVISGTYTDIGVQADANGSRTVKSLSKLLEVEDPNKVQDVTIRAGAIGENGTGELVIAARRDGTVVKTRVLGYQCVKGEAVVIDHTGSGNLYLLMMWFENTTKSFSAANDGSLVIKSHYNFGALVLLVPVWADTAELFRFERIPEAAVR